MSEMSNENKETIADIVREMRTLGRLDEKSTDKIPRSLQALGLRIYADRIEAAAKHQFRDTTKMIPEEVAVSKLETTTPTCEKSSQVGNAAAMREEKASLMQRLEMCQKVNEQQEKEYLALKSENARLRAALKPVLDIVMDSATSDLSMEMAINEAKRIYKEECDEDNPSLWY